MWSVPLSTGVRSRGVAVLFLYILTCAQCWWFYGCISKGTGFLSKLECSQCPSPILENLTFVDTPGVLSGKKQSIGRSYDFTGVIDWFAEKSDLILLLFDAHKLDISDEFKEVITQLKRHDEKIRVVLNKASAVPRRNTPRGCAPRG